MRSHNQRYICPIRGGAVCRTRVSIIPPRWCGSNNTLVGSWRLQVSAEFTRSVHVKHSFAVSVIPLFAKTKCSRESMCCRLLVNPIGGFILESSTRHHQVPFHLTAPYQHSMRPLRCTYQRPTSCAILCPFVFPDDPQQAIPDASSHLRLPTRPLLRRPVLHGDIRTYNRLASPGPPPPAPSLFCG